jgi:hypothetical protein
MGDFQCSVCGASFDSEDELIMHIRATHLSLSSKIIIREIGVS